jgi:hypothetical protein
MATATQSKKSQVLEYLHSGRGLTASQARRMFDVANFRATISNIKEQVERYGNWRIVTSENRDGETRYSLKRVRLVGPSNYTVGNR